MKIGNVVVTDGYHDDIGIILFVEWDDVGDTNWISVRWSSGQITWEMQDDLQVIA